MEFAHILLSYAVLTVVVSTCVSLPVKTENDDDTGSTSLLDLPKDVISEVLKETFSQVHVEVPNVMMSDKDRHLIVKRSKRAGIMTASMCAKDHLRLPNGECFPCKGLQNGECGDDYGDDDSDNEVE